MEKPDSEYSRYSDQMEYKVDKFLALHDALTKGQFSFITTNPITQLVSCKLTISEFYRQTGESFDLAFVGDNIEFVLDHLKNNVEAVRSAKFLESIFDMGDMKRQDFLALFLPLKEHYRKMERDKRRIETESKLMHLLYGFLSFAFILQFLFLFTIVFP